LVAANEDRSEEEVLGLRPGLESDIVGRDPLQGQVTKTGSAGQKRAFLLFFSQVFIDFQRFRAL
jgi:hypothetical protein